VFLHSSVEKVDIGKGLDAARAADLVLTPDTVMPTKSSYNLAQNLCQKLLVFCDGWWWWPGGCDTVACGGDPPEPLQIIGRIIEHRICLASICVVGAVLSVGRQMRHCVPKFFINLLRLLAVSARSSTEGFNLNIIV
jgi:hypothetical protein